MAIDWTNAYIGDPMGDVARTSLIFLSPFNPPGTPKILILPLRLFKKVMNRVYLKEYCKQADIQPESIRQWILPVAAARLQENIPGEREWLIKLIVKQFKHMVPADA